MKKSIILLFIFFIFLSAGCVTTYNPATGREETIMYSREKEIAIGQAVAKKLEKEYKVIEEQTQYMEWVGGRIAFASDRIALPYSFKVLDWEDINALSLPGGPVYISKALMDIMNEDELAVIIGHEIAHITARHGVKKLQAHKLYTLLAVALVSTENTREAAKFTIQAMNILFLGYSQKDELLADHLGVKYAYEAGFDPWAAITVMEKLRDETRKKGGRHSWFSTHPLTYERIEELKKYITTLTPKKSSPEPVH